MTSKRAGYFNKNPTLEDIIKQKTNKNLTLRKAKIEAFIDKKRFLSSSYNAYSTSTGISSDQDEEAIFYASMLNEDFSKFKLDLYCQLLSGDKNNMIRGLIGIRKSLSDPFEPPIQQAIENGSAEKIITIMNNSKNNIILFEVLWILTNIASGDSSHTVFLISNGLIDFLPNLFNVISSDLLVEQMIWLIANLAADENYSIRFSMLKLNYLEYLMRILNDQRYFNYKRSILWAISNILRNFPRLVNISSEIEKLVTDCCWLINNHKSIISENKNKVSISDSEVSYAITICSNLAEHNNYFVEYFLKNRIIENLLDLLDFYRKKESDFIFDSILRLIGDYASYNDKSTTEIVDNGIMLTLKDLIYKDRRIGVKKECCWIMSNILAGLTEHIKMFYKIDGSLDLFFSLVWSGSHDVKKEALWCIVNLTSFLTVEILNDLMNFKLIQIIGDWLNNKDYKISAVCIETLDNILYFCKGGHHLDSLKNKVYHECHTANIEEKLEKLQYHDNDLVADKSTCLLAAYFSNEDDYDSDLSPFKIQTQAEQKEDQRLRFIFGALAKNSPTSCIMKVSDKDEDIHIFKNYEDFFSPMKIDMSFDIDDGNFK